MKKIKIILSLIVLIVIFSILYIIQIDKCKKNNKEWEKYMNKPILGDSETGTLFDPFVMVDNDGKYRMYVSWRDMGAIAVTTSDDGINWEQLKIVLEKDESTGWEKIINRATVVYKDGKYHMWYTGQENGISKIGYAISDDGYNFKRNGREPIMIPEKEWENKSVMNPHVIYDEDEKIYKMWYAAGETYEPDVIAYATSLDGITWNKFENNPILKANKDKNTFDNYKVGACDVHKLSKNEYLMFYIGYTNINTARIFTAKSSDGINWIRYGKTPIIEPTKNTFDSDACYKPTVIWDKTKNKWMLWYNGRTGNKEYIGYAYCNDYNFMKTYNEE